MTRSIALITTFVLAYTSQAQNFQSTIRLGNSTGEVQAFIRPDFDADNNYLLQLQFAFSFDATAPVSDLKFNLHPDFTSRFGDNYKILKHAISHDPSHTEKFFVVTLTRTGPGASDAQSWRAGTEYPVVTATLELPSISSASPAVRLVDYKGGSSNGQVNTYVLNSTNKYYYDWTVSTNNFYGTETSVVGGNPDNGFVKATAKPVISSNLAFSGQKTGSVNVLKWNVNGEVNNSGYEIQRSSDGVSFHVIGFVYSQSIGGNSAAELVYAYTDNTPLAGAVNYYRLFQKDLDGNGRHSNTVEIGTDKPTSHGITGLFPNPASDVVHVIITAPIRQELTVAIVDALGKTVKQKEVNVEPGANTIPINIGNLATGSFMVKLVCQSGCESTLGKFVKQ